MRHENNMGRNAWRVCEVAEGSSLMATATLKCRHCKSRFPRESMLTLPNGAYCTMDHAIAYGREQGQKLRQRKHRERKRARNDESLPHQLKLTQMAVNKMVRLLDQGKPCISCGEYRELEAGHYRSVGSMPSLRFDLRNIVGQCRPCNFGGTRSHKRGKNPALVRDMFEAGLRERLGNDCVDWLNGPHEPKHWSIPGLKEMRKVAAEEIRRLEAGEKPLWDWRAFP